ncbi:hypothetical protein ABK040_015767 [Willaertia magna]
MNATVCTENLSPILSILPYRGKIGLSKYLIPNILFNSKYRYEQFNGYNNGKLITNIEILNNTFIDNLCIYDLIPFYFNIYIHTLKVNIPINNIKLLSSKNRNTILELWFINLQVLFSRFKIQSTSIIHYN